MYKGVVEGSEIMILGNYPRHYCKQMTESVQFQYYLYFDGCPTRSHMVRSESFDDTDRTIHYSHCSNISTSARFLDQSQ